MKYLGSFSLLVVLFFAAIALLTGPGCANMFPPTGGPKDTLPPVLVDARPENVSIDFKSNKIVLEFDEYLDVKDLRQNLVVKIGRAHV